ncbi:autotransporter outer membrane beta-barrel domain-containing protein [Brucella sp. TWI432]
MTLGTNGGTIQTTAAKTNTFSGTVTGTGKLTKTGDGTLVLSSTASDYTGGTQIDGGVVSVSANANLGAATGALGFNGGTLLLTDSFDNSRAVTLGTNGGTIQTTAAKTNTFSGTVTGTGKLTKTGDGTLVLAGTASDYTGGTQIDGGVVSVSANANLGAATGALGFDGGTLLLTDSFDNSRTVALGANGGTIQTTAAKSNSFSGTVTGTGKLTKAGSGTLVLTGANTYNGGTEVSGGVLQIGDGHTTGSILGNVTVDAGAALALNRSDNVTYASLISGAGSLHQDGAGMLILTGTNTYTGGTVISAGTLQVGDGGTAGSIQGDVTNNATLAFNRSNGLDFSGKISGSGALNQIGAGSLTISGDSSAFTGTTDVTAGSLIVTGTLGDATSTLQVASGAFLAGSGTIGGDTTIANGATLTGLADNTLTFNGNLSLGATSVVSVTYGAEFGQPFFDVKGNLALGGKINVADFGDNGPGIYHVFNYGGTLSGTIAVGDMPQGVDPAKITVQTAMTGEVNLVNAEGAVLNFWDGGDAAKHNNGTVEGGDGTWNLLNSNWTGLPDYTLNGPWASGEFAVFQGTKGTVTIDNTGGQVSATGLQFAIDGYTIKGGDLELAPSADEPDEVPSIRVGDGEDTDVGKTATIEAKLTGSSGMEKHGVGTLILTADNSYTGGTVVAGGTLQLGNGGTTGSVAGDINLGSTAASAGTLAISRSGMVTVANNISGTGHIVIDGPGTIELTGTNDELAGAFIRHGTLVVSGDANMGASGSSVEIENGSVLRFGSSFDSDHNYVLAKGDDSNGGMIETTGTNINRITTAITGPGSLIKEGTGTLVLAADSNYAGGTTVSGGTLQIGDGGTTGRVDNAIINNGVVAFNRSDAVAMGNVISGAGSVQQIGSGALTLTGDNTYSGGTTVSAGTLIVAKDENLGDKAGGLTIDGGLFENTGAITTSRNVTIAANGGTLQTDASLTLQGAFDASASTAGWHKTGTGELVFDTGATGDVGSGAAIDAGKVTVKGSMSGDYMVNSGATLDVLGSQNGNISVNDGGMLMGGGTVEKNVTVADNAILQGKGGQTLTIGGDLVLNTGSQINVTLGMPSNTALYDVKGDVTLAGTLNISDGGGFGAGIYRLMDYNGNLTDNTLAIGSTPGGTDAARMWIDNDAANKHVNLMNSSGVHLDVWEGGNGTWNLVSDHTNDVWTDNGDHIMGAYDQGSFAVFRGTTQGATTTVTLDNSAGQVTASGMNFASDGYILKGSPLNLDNTAQPIIRVGDGTDAGKAMTATIEAELQGTKGINKTDYGTLILTGANHYSGGTTVTGGTLQIGNGGTSGSIDGDVNLASDLYGHGTLAFDHSGPTLFAGNISGAGDVIQKGSGTTTFTGDNSYSGGLTVENGKAQAGVAGHAFGTGVLKLKDGAIADLDSFDTTVGGLAAFDDTNAVGDGKIALGTGKLTVVQNFDSRFSGVISGSGGFTKAGSGELTLNGINTYGGVTNVDGGSLKQGAAGVFNTASSGYIVGANGTLDLGGFDTTLASLSNAGRITSGIETAGTSLTVNGNYVGNGGTVVINTVLGDDSSKTDMLKVGGDTSGTTSLKVINRGGLGAQTTNGIEVVDVAGDSKGIFSLVSDYTTKDGQKAVVGGAYAYTLQQGSGNKDGNWYLTSQYTPGPGPNPNPDCVGDNCPNPTPNPRYNPGVPVYQGYAENMQALNKLPTLQERVGERYWTGRNGDGQANGAVVDSRGIWARIEGAHSRLEPQSATGAKQDVNTFIMQAGVDGQFYEDENGRLVAGITGQYGTAHASSSALAGDGTARTNAWSLGATATWYGNNGFYVDAQGQVTWFDNDLNSDTANTGLVDGAKAYGYAMSVEAGQRVAINDHWSLMPQAQLMWSSLDADAFHDVWGSRVHMQDGDSLTGRFGVAASYDNSWKGNGGLMVNTSVYGVANLYQSFLGGTRINVAGVNIDTDNDKTWAGIGAGGTYAWADSKYAVYGEGSINTSLNHFADSYELKATVGFKVKW